MKFSDYYKMKTLKVTKSHRLDCVASTGDYEPFEMRASRSRDKRFHCYHNDVPQRFSANALRKASYAITDGNNISSVYIPDTEQPLKGYGDMKGTNDALLFLYSPDYNELEIFVARGGKHHVKNLSALFLDGELDWEMEELRKKAKSIGGNVQEQ